MTNPDVRPAEFVLPKARMVPRLIEIGLPLAAAMVGVYLGTVDSSWNEELPLSVVLILVFALFGATMTCRSLAVGRGFIRNDIALVSTTYRGYELERVAVPRNGFALAELTGYGLVPLRWSTMDPVDRANPGHERTAQMIEEAYAGSSGEPPGAVQGSVERGWVRWRLKFWIILVLGCPLPYLFGSWFAS